MLEKLIKIRSAMDGHSIYRIKIYVEITIGLKKNSLGNASNLLWCLNGPLDTVAELRASISYNLCYVGGRKCLLINVNVVTIICIFRTTGLVDNAQVEWIHIEWDQTIADLENCNIDVMLM